MLIIIFHLSFAYIVYCWHSLVIPYATHRNSTPTHTPSPRIEYNIINSHFPNLSSGYADVHMHGGWCILIMPPSSSMRRTLNIASVHNFYNTLCHVLYMKAFNNTPYFHIMYGILFPLYNHKYPC